MDSLLLKAFLKSSCHRKVYCYFSTSLELVEGRADWPHGYDELRNIDVFHTRTRRRSV